jgi:hypothetical protein
LVLKMSSRDYGFIDGDMETSVAATVSIWILDKDDRTSTDFQANHIIPY